MTAPTAAGRRGAKPAQAANDTEVRGHIVLALMARPGSHEPDLRAMWAANEQIASSLTNTLHALGWEDVRVIPAFRKAG